MYVDQPRVVFVFGCNLTGMYRRKSAWVTTVTGPLPFLQKLSAAYARDKTDMNRR